MTGIHATAPLLLGSGGVAWAWHRRTARNGWHTAAFIAGVLLAGAVAIGPLDAVAEDRSLTAHMVQHLVLMSAAPALLLAGGPGTSGWLARWSRSLGPALGLLAGCVAIVWMLHVPAVFDAKTASGPLNDLSHLLLLAAGLGMTWPLAARERLPGLAAVYYLVAAEVAIGALGMWLAWYPEIVYSVYDGARPLFGISPATDQAVAGALLLVVEEPFLAVECAVLFIAALDDGDGDSAAGT